MKRKQISSDILKNAGLKITNERKAVLDLLIKTSTPMSANDLWNKLSAKMNQATVYRILKQLVKSRILYQTDFREAQTFYEYQHKHHHHIICTACGKKELLRLCLPRQLERKVKNASKIFKGNLDHTLEFFGTCNSCEK